MKPEPVKPVQSKAALYQRIARILEFARVGVARTVNTTQGVANWLVGREIVEAEQSGKMRVQYGEELIRDLAQRLTQKFGRGYSPDNLFWFRRFFEAIQNRWSARELERQINSATTSSLVERVTSP